MGEALKEAEKAFDAGEVPVGALILSPQGEIMARAYNLTRQNACAHAEMLAIQEACLRLNQKYLEHYIMVVTLEPCLMCMGAISLARLSGVVFGAWDKFFGAVSSKWDYPDLPLQYQNNWFLGGILAPACADILKKFFHKLRSDK